MHVCLLIRISKEHAVINNSKDTKVTLKPMKGCKVFLNGNEITGEKELHHNDVSVHVYFS